MHQISRHFESRILPLRRIIEEESLLHYNGMLTDVSDLLADTKAGISAQIKAVNARRDFFIAENQLEAAILGGSAGSNLDLTGGGSSGAAAQPAGH
jgi:outer membrane protein TolC